MPKEVTHWLIAEAVSRSLRGTFLEEPLGRNQNLLHIGAVVHDAPYYYLKADRGARFGDLPRRLHGTVDDAYELIGALLRSTRERPPEEQNPLLAVLVGLVTHLFADALLHPMIFYLTGPYDHPSFRTRTVARQDHRRLEALIDIRLAGGYAQVRKHSLASRLDAAEFPLDELFRVAGSAWLGPERAAGFAAGMVSAFRLFAFMQGLYRNPVLGRLAFRLFPVVPSFLREILALVYSPQLTRYEGRIAGDIVYRHPCSGREETHRLDDLVHRAAEESLAFCRGLEPLLDPAEKRPARLVLPAVDPGLGFNPDHPLCHHAERRFFA